MHPLQIQGQNTKCKSKFQQAWARGSILGKWDGAGLRALHQQKLHLKLKPHGDSKLRPTDRSVWLWVRDSPKPVLSFVK